MHIAVLGMGRMGQALARRLLGGGHSVVVWNRSPGKADEVVAAGATEAGSVAEAVKAAEVVITSLTADEAVRAVAFGEGGLRAAIGAEAVYADASTVSPAMSEELAAAFPRFVALPILGPPAGVESGKAVYLAGGDPSAVERLEPILATLADTVRRYDTPAKAGHAKLASNLMLLAEVAALAEAITVARSGGLTDDQIRVLLGEGAMLAPGVKNRFEGVLHGEMEAWWSAALGAKDARLAAEAATAAGVDLPLARTVQGLYDEAAAAGTEDDDIVAVARRYRPPRSGG
jgi:3-hydroxyisobutyrate dehydrogenase